MLKIRRWLAWLLLGLFACSETNEPTTGLIVITTQTTGRDLDLDGYTIAVDGVGATPVPINGGVTLEGVSSGEHALTLTGLDANCSLQGESPITVSVTDSTPATATVTVACALANTLAFVQGTDIYVTSIEAGATPVRIATNFTFPAWSRDGSALAAVPAVFFGGLFIMDAAGNNLRSLTGQVSETQRFSRASWSPDGHTLLFDYRDCAGPISCLHVSIKRVQSDGTGYGAFLSGFHETSGATYVPDGSRVAYNDNGSICLADPDGGNAQCIDRGQSPDWSPDGTLIAYNSYEADTIYTIRPDGSDQRALTVGAGGFNNGPLWSPDGTQIAYAHRDSTFAPDRYMIMNADGGGRRALAPELVSRGMAWSFDGIHIALAATLADTDAVTKIYLINRDGSGLRLLSNEDSSLPAWRP